MFQLTLNIYSSSNAKYLKFYCLKSSPGGGGYSHTLPIRVCAAQRGRDFEAPDLERGIKNCGSRLYLLLKIVADYEEAFI